MTEDLSNAAGEALRILAWYPELATPEAMHPKALKQFSEASLSEGLRELEGLGLVRQTYGLWELTDAGRSKAGRAASLPRRRPL